MSVYKREGKWWIDYYKGTKRIRESIGAVDVITRRAVQNILKKRKLDVIQKKWLDLKEDNKISFNDMAELFYKKHSLATKRSHHRDSELIEHLKAFFKNKNIDEISSEDIEDYRTNRKLKFINDHKREMKPATLNREIACLKAIYNKAIAWKKFNGVNPVEGIALYKENNERKRFMTQAEIQGLFNSSSECLKRIITFLIFTGARVSEALDLTWGDIDFRNNLIYIRHSKSGYGRQIPLNSTLKIMLENDTMGIEKIDDCYVFPNKSGGKIKTIRGPFKTACKRAKIKDLHPHDLRHTAASYLVMSGCDLATVREILGHRDIATTMRYAHLSQPHKARAIEKLSSAMIPVTLAVTNGNSKND